MKIVGILGGIGPESTVEYYRQTIAAYRERKKDGSSPSILIHSIDVRRLLDLAAGAPEDLTAYLAAGVRVLERGGADLALMAANTPHVVFEDVRRRTAIPLVSIVEAARDAAKASGLRRLGLFGTRFTMEGGFYQDVFAAEGMAIVAPSQEERAFVHDRYVNELVKGVFLPATRERLEGIAAALRERDRIDGLILGGTELPLILKDPVVGGVPALDTTRIHVDAAVTRLLAAEASEAGG